jgi:hypothetical protein
MSLKTHVEIMSNFRLATMSIKGTARMFMKRHELSANLHIKKLRKCGGCASRFAPRQFHPTGGARLGGPMKNMAF